MTVRSYIEHEEKKHEGISQTQAVAGINSLSSKSLESSDSVQQNEGSQGRQEDNRRKSVAGTVTHQSHLSDFHFSLGRDR